MNVTRGRAMPLLCATLLCLDLALKALCAPTDTAKDLVFLLDVSSGMEEAERFIVAGAHLATFQLASADRIALITVGSTIRSRLVLTNQKDPIEQAFRTAIPLFVGGRRPPRLYDGVWGALRALGATGKDRKSFIIVITNQGDRGSAHALEELIEKARDQQVTIEAFLVRDARPGVSRLGWPTDTAPSDLEAAVRTWRAVVSPTGGTVSVVDVDGYILRKAVAICGTGAQ